MAALTNSDGWFALRARTDPRSAEAAFETAGDDRAALEARARDLLAEGAYGRIDLLIWNLELNDWVRIERFERG